MPNPPSNRVLSRARALDEGWSDGALARASARGRIIRIRPGQFVAPSDRGDRQLAAIAAQRATASSVISHRSAALMHDLPIVGQDPPVPEITVPPRTTGDTENAHLYRATLPSGHVTELGGVPVTTIARTVADLARDVSINAGVAAIDFALHERLETRDGIRKVLQSCRGWPGIRRARVALDWADSRSESPLESISRIAISGMALPVPDLQPDIFDANGFVGRADFYWDEPGLVGEADGRAKYEDRDVLVSEKLRQERMEEAGLIVVRWIWTDVRERPAALKLRIQQAFERGCARAGTPALRGWSVVRLAPDD